MTASARETPSNPNLSSRPKRSVVERPAVLFALKQHLVRLLERSLEYVPRQGEGHLSEAGQEKDVHANRRKPAIFEQDGLEAVHGIGKRIDVRNSLQPLRQSGDRRDRAAGKKQ